MGGCGLATIWSLPCKKQQGLPHNAIPLQSPNYGHDCHRQTAKDHCHGVVLTHTHMYTYHHRQRVQAAMHTNVFVYTSKWASWHKKHHQCKLHVITTASASEVFVLVDDRKTPPVHVAEGQDHGYTCTLLCLPTIVAICIHISCTYLLERTGKATMTPHRQQWLDYETTKTRHAHKIHMALCITT